MTSSDTSEATAGQTPRLIVSEISKTFGAGDKATHVLDRMSFSVNDSEFFSIVGPSGAGKTTLLRCLSGLMQPDSGEVYFDGRLVTAPPREFALVFQDYSRSLYPWLTVAKNVELPLKAHGIDKAERAQRVAKALASVGLDHAAQRFPWQVSGGMQQRAAIARALAYNAQVLVLDEPFASVDAQTRSDLEDLLLKLRTETGATFVFVTHDIDEAVYLSDRVTVVSASPSRVDRIIDIDLPVDRDQLTTKALPRFAELRGEVFTTVRHMVRPTATTEEVDSDFQI
ncbi:ABC transporter ATP-binding protein [Parenemella sanctibonifatiensis]|uniref:ABC transporter n=1 Tax=Parenemella sanctibonifatiensis TaxID=2016505 RepID=A0A255EHW1_9ACTN|nr:ABC transporter ATP-binding protein [Parenemella sanctibonifatiensis]OYN91107.1 ABC transporter [Parenemella sanctibonifatiensis]